MGRVKKRAGKLASKEVRSVNDQRPGLLVQVVSERSARAALIRADRERGEPRSKESPKEALDRYKTYLFSHLPLEEATVHFEKYLARHPLASNAPAELPPHVGRPLKKAQGLIHHKHFIENKPYRQCFDELYAESNEECLSDPYDRKSREKSITTNVEAYEARLSKKRGGL
jgi:hypothetical protein